MENKIFNQTHLDYTAIPCAEKSNNGGSGRPFGKHAFGSRRSSKKGCAQASNCNRILS